jgi:hypothetical protein
MTPSDELHCLIKSLQPHEKRYFRLYASKYTTAEDNNYILLFEAIDNQAIYDEEALLEKHPGKFFASDKNYLFQQLLSSLYEQEKHNKEKEWIRKLGKAQILFSRDQPNGGYKLLRKCKTEAVAEENYLQLLQAIRLEKTIASAQYFKGLRSEDIEALHREEQECLARLENANAYWLLFSRFYHYHYSKGSVRDKKYWEEIRKIFSHPLLEDINKAMSFQTKLDFYGIHALYYFMQGKTAKAMEYNKAHLELYESRPEKIKEYSKRYLALLNNYLMDSLGMKDFDAVKAGIDRMRRLPEDHRNFNTASMRSDIYRLSTLLELNYLIHTAQFETGAAIAASVMKESETAHQTLLKHSRLTMSYLAAYIFFGAGEFKKALNCLNKIMNDAEVHILEDLQAFSRIFFILVHFELGNLELIEGLQASTQRYLQKNNKFYQTEFVLLKGLSMINGVMNTRERTKAFKKIQTDVKLLLQTEEERKASDYFDIEVWLQSKAENLSFSSLAKRKAEIRTFEN